MLQQMKYLGLDYGTKRIGVAISDGEGRVAFPLATVAAGARALSEVDALVQKNGAQQIVLGESRDFAGAENAVQEDIGQFKKDLEELSSLPVVYEPEFMTSVQAQRSGGDDSSAAALILQSYLDKMNR